MNVRRNTERGVTLTELLVVMLIIALLSTIAVPVYLSRAEVARVRTAQAEVREIANAEDVCAAIHGFYVPLQTLNDLPITPETLGGHVDRINNYNSGLNALLVEPTLPLGNQVNNQFDLADWDSNTLMAELVQEWQGPFINYQREYMGIVLDDNNIPRFVSAEIDVEFPEVKADLPLDPWGEPYRIFSPIGITGLNANSSGASQLDPTEFLAGNFSTTNFFNEFNLTLNDNTSATKTDADPYDTWAIVSFGPDRTADQNNANDDNDDIYYLFGLVAPESGFSSRRF